MFREKDICLTVVSRQIRLGAEEVVGVFADAADFE